jgi:hypothetical protein
MKASEGGIGLSDILDMDMEDFADWHSAAAELEDRIAKAMKNKR